MSGGKAQAPAKGFADCMTLRNPGFPWRFVLLFCTACAMRACGAPMGILVPAYFYPGSLWTNMNWAAARVPLVAIMNPNSGPDTTQNPDYVAAVSSLRASGAKVIGYVSTSYTARSTNNV